MGPELVHQCAKIVKFIQEKLKTAQSRQKSYADTKRRPLQLDVGDYVFLKVSPTKGVLRFTKRGNLSPRYVESLLSCVGRHLGASFGSG